MTTIHVQPWGTSPTPLLPKAIIRAVGHYPVPQSLKKELGVDGTMADLDGYNWEGIESVSKKCLRELIELVRPRLPSLYNSVFRCGESITQPIQSLPLSTKTRNLVSGNLDKFSSPHLTLRNLMSICSCGARSAIEFACVLEAALNNSVSYDDSNLKLQTTHEITTNHSAFSDINYTFQILAAYAAGERNLRTLSDVMPITPEEWPTEVKELWGNLANIRSDDLAGEFKSKYSVPELVLRIVTPIDDRSREILSSRVFATEHLVTLDEIGQRYSISRERVRQLEKEAIAYLKLLNEVEFLPIIRRAKALRQQLGAALPASDSLRKEALDWVTTDFRIYKEIDLSFVKAIFLWLAGPYKIHCSWLQIEQDLLDLTRDALLDCQENNGFIDEKAIFEVLTRFEINQRYHDGWLNRLNEFRRIDNGIIYISGSILEKAKTLLRYAERPLTVEEILEFVGGGSIRSVRNRLIDDPGFWRINKQCQFVVAGTPGYDEYTNITEEILQELEACGGQAHFNHLVEKLSRVYGVKKNSVIAYINTLMFTKDERGFVRRRDTNNKIEIHTDISKTAACYCTKNGIWFTRVEVDSDMVRGSGRSIPNAFAQQLNCNIGDRVVVESEHGQIKFSWPLTSTVGATIGSLRTVLDNFSANIEDFLFIKLTSPLLTFDILRKESLVRAHTNLIRLALFLGCDSLSSDAEALEAIVDLFGLSGTTDEARYVEIKRLLQTRGETELAELVPDPLLSVDEYISNIGNLLNS